LENNVGPVGGSARGFPEHAVRGVQAGDLRSNQLPQSSGERTGATGQIQDFLV